MTDSDRDTLCRECVRNLRRDFGLRRLVNVVFEELIDSCTFDARVMAALARSRNAVLDWIYPTCPTAPAARLTLDDVDVRIEDAPASADPLLDRLQQRRERGKNPTNTDPITEGGSS